MLGALLGSWRTLAIGAAAGALALLLWRLDTVAAARDAATSRAIEAEASARASAEALEQIKAEHARSVEIITAAAQAERARLLAAADLKRKVQNAPATSNCMGSPAVAAALDGLRQRATSAGNPGGAVDGAGLPAVLPAGPAGPVTGRR